ncbi:MAG: phosphoenolpyruvate--protein phosphotransferase [Clostridia bacterium BRH_c25]|nr:MAG: phosphoenolpyruvate--protein phosphotransferase [Clostridia bacterium BRH_c25]
MMQGIGVSPGIVIGIAFIKKTEKMEICKMDIANTKAEISRLHAARETAKVQIGIMQQQVEAQIGSEEAKIFEAHMDMIEDKTLFKDIEKRIQSQKVNAEWAVKEAADKFISMFQTMENAYMSERAADIKDVTSRLIKVLVGVESVDISRFEQEVIIVAEDLLPSDTAKMDKTKVKGFITEQGGKTSHSAIMARTLEIPAAAGVTEATSIIKNGDALVLDGESGQVFVNPDASIIKKFSLRKQGLIASKNLLNAYKGVSSTSKDGFTVKVMANVGTPEDTEAVIKNDSEGIGLFRSEFLYMDRNQLPSEEEQFAAYRIVAEKLDSKPVIIRTLDIGGDKALPYLGLVKEENPFLGYRAIRFCLDSTDVFITQLRAILRASAFGRIKIMFPMISDVLQLRQAKALLAEAKESLRKASVQFDESIAIGIMIEIPSAALISDLIADEVDFFSIGTNDLIQYMTAVDRGNQKIAHLYNSFHPAVLRLIKLIIDNAHKKGKWVGMCGEAAGDPKLIPIFLGMGLNEFSMSPASVLKARCIINNTHKKEMESMAEKLLNMSTAEEIERFIDENVDICSGKETLP